MTHAVWVGLASVRDFWAGGEKSARRLSLPLAWTSGPMVWSEVKVFLASVGFGPASLFSVAWRKRRRYELPLGDCAPWCSVGRLPSRWKSRDRANFLTRQVQGVPWT